MQGDSKFMRCAPTIDGNAVPIRYWSRIRNNGDAFTSLLISKLLKGVPIHVRETSPHVLGTGSILFMANSYSTIWGSGVLNKQAYLPQLAPEQIRALRGKHSADFLTQKGLRLGQLPFGDPGIFAADVIDIREQGRAAKYKVALVPHHDSARHPFFLSAAERDDVCIVDMLDDGLQPIQQIAESEIVFSQSLHGLVYAESLSKPSLWISTRSDEVWNFKFHDWFTTTNNPQCAPVFLNTPFESMVKQAERRYSLIDKDELLSSFPADSVTRLDEVFIDHETCRNSAPLRFFFMDQDARGAGGTSNLSQEGDLEPLSRLVNSALSRIFSHWAERTYSLAAKWGSKPIPSVSQSRIMMREMDLMASVDYAFVTGKQNTLPAGATQIDLPEGVTLYRNLNVKGEVLFLRPSHERLTENFVVFGI
jgi:hypothetical protein